MQSATFKLIIENDREMIIMPGTAMQICIYHLDQEPFWPNPDKLQFYGDDHGAPIAFETDLDSANLENITGAMLWYARYLDHPDMHLGVEDPRPARRLTLVR